MLPGRAFVSAAKRSKTEKDECNGNQREADPETLNGASGDKDNTEYQPEGFASEVPDRADPLKRKDEHAEPL